MERSDAEDSHEKKIPASDTEPSLIMLYLGFFHEEFCRRMILILHTEMCKQTKASFIMWVQSCVSSYFDDRNPYTTDLLLNLLTM